MSRSVRPDYDALRAHEAARETPPAAPEAITPDAPTTEGEGATHV